MVAPHLRPALSSSLPVLYLMAPIRIYGTPVLEAAREFPFHMLTGCRVDVWVCEDLYRSNPEWQARWPEVRSRAAFGVFLDHMGGWVARGTWAETAELMVLGRPVWWFNGGEPTDRFGFGPAVGRGGDWARLYRRVGLGWGRPVLTTRTKPLQPLSGDVRTLQGALEASSPGQVCGLD
jgi:hypothetical protein